jgi:hypothetical protein
MRHDSRSVDLWNLILVAALAILASAAHAQEPRTPIKPADPVSAASHDVAVLSADCVDKPVVQPTPLPRLDFSLGEYARRIRAAHNYVPKAATYRVNDDAPIEEVAYREFR